MKAKMFKNAEAINSRERVLIKLSFPPAGTFSNFKRKKKQNRILRDSSGIGFNIVIKIGSNIDIKICVKFLYQNWVEYWY